MNVQPNAKMGLEEFLDHVPLKHLLGLAQADLDQAMATGYQLYQAGRYAEAEVICRGLVAADHTYGWTYSLYAAVLRKQGRLREAIEQIDRGLRYEPGQPKLLAMREELVRFVEFLAAAQERQTTNLPSTPAAVAADAEVR